MSRPSALDFWELPRFQSLLESLSLLPPERTWEILHEIRDAELEAFEADDLAGYEAHGRAALNAAPLVAVEHDLDDVAEEFARFMQKRHFDCVFLMVYAARMLSDPDFAATLCPARGFEHLEAVVSSGGGIVLPMHMGPYAGIVPLLAFYRPVTTILEAAAEDQFRLIESMYLPTLDIERIGMPDRRVLLKLLRALRRGRLVCMFPEFSWGYDQPQRRTDLLGATIEAPEGPQRLAQHTGLPLLPCRIVARGAARFELSFSPPIVVGPGEEGLDVAVRETFAFVESAVLADPDQWQGWDFFSELLPSDHERASLVERFAARAAAS